MYKTSNAQNSDYKEILQIISSTTVCQMCQNLRVVINHNLLVTRLTLASVLGPLGVHLLSFILPTPVHYDALFGVTVISG